MSAINERLLKVRLRFECHQCVNYFRDSQFLSCYFIMPNFDQDVNRSDERPSSAGAVLGVNLALSEKVLMGLLSLFLTFFSGMVYGRISMPEAEANVELQSHSQCEVPVEQKELVP